MRKSAEKFKCVSGILEITKGLSHSFQPLKNKENVYPLKRAQLTLFSFLCSTPSALNPPTIEACETNSRRARSASTDNTTDVNNTDGNTLRSVCVASFTQVAGIRTYESMGCGERALENEGEEDSSRCVSDAAGYDLECSCSDADGCNGVQNNYGVVDEGGSDVIAAIRQLKAHFDKKMEEVSAKGCDQVGS